MKTTGIYKISNSVNDKVYIGMTKDFKDRFSRHRRGLAGGYHDNKEMLELFSSYGDVFTYEIVHSGNFSMKELCEMERSEIKKHNSYTEGYNYTLGGLGSQGLRHTEESSKKMAEYRSVHFRDEGNPFYGKKHTRETKDKIAETTSKTFKGKPKPQGQKDKMSLASPRCKKVVIDNKVFRSITEASKETGICRRTISNRIQSVNFINYRVWEAEEMPNDYRKGS